MIDFKELDKLTIFLMLVVFAVGLLCLHSASYNKGVELSTNFALKQLIWMAIGFVILLPVILAVDYQRIIDMGYLLYGLGLIFLAMVLVLGHIRLGAQRWISIAGFAFQPSEFNKIIYVIMMTSYLGHSRDGIRGIKGLAVPFILTLPPFALILLQPDLGTALIMIPVLFVMLFAAGAKLRHLAMILLSGALMSPLFWHFLREYQRKRLMVFLNPDADPLGAGYTVIQSKIAIGSGGIFGKGWLAGTQNQLNFLPERHTDFIFSVVGEEWGFIGASVLIGLYFLILKRAFMIVEGTTDIYGKLLGTGLITMLAFQIFINISMVMGFMPVVGVPLPLMSYGGSSVWTTIIALGLILNVGMRRTRF